MRQEEDEKKQRAAEIFAELDARNEGREFIKNNSTTGPNINANTDSEHVDK